MIRLIITTILTSFLFLSGINAQDSMTSRQKDNVKETEQRIRHNKNVTKIKIEEDKGDLEKLPKGAFIKKESSYNVKTGKRISQSYVILPKKDEKE